MTRRAVFALAVAACLAVAPARAEVTLKGPVEQGALVIGKTEPGARVTLDGESVMVSRRGYFAIGFDRDHGPRARLVVASPGGTETKDLKIAPRAWNVQSITGIAPKYVTPPPEQIERIKREQALKRAARPRDTDEDWFAGQFIWPSKGPISGVFGSQRIFNGEPRNPHYGVDVAAPKGAPVVAPADGIVRLAEPDMFFEGGLIFIDHGQGVFSQMMHMSRIDVKAGQHVTRGERIGAVGGTGRATGPHMHWGMLWRGAHVDPSLMVAGIGPEGAKPGMTAK
ncbi:MAG: M23 family metallopeptidase [Parvibaculum sp.]|uniref:M23 family metallopeptidase n=1 Tax=Parvibaculum sp. TaxID=2024848 RepID=UPI0025CECD63|nr:M23 family metallopeptidase [Parvibaculum sp.]MCE9648646.1 M23 family metallopeptidase [Parvibaculum sp.]